MDNVPVQESVFCVTAKQTEALRLIGSEAPHVLLVGGSRSGKTFIAMRAIVIRAMAADGSRHAVLRLRFNHVKSAVVQDTFPKVMKLCFPSVAYTLNKTDWIAEFQNGSQIWFAGLDDKERTEKILGQEYATIFLNECSQIPYNSRNIAVTRLAQKATYLVGEERRQLRRKMIYDCNPPSQAHWIYKLFVKGIDPDTQVAVDRQQLAYMTMNPTDNTANLPEDYVETLSRLPARMRIRFLEGKFADVTENALWSIDMIERNRSGDTELPDMQRIIISVDPSGAGDTENTSNDAIGIIVVGLGTDGRAYILEDLTVKAGPSVWGTVVANAFDRHGADLVVAETNFGGEMVKFVIRAAKPGIPFKKVVASRGKVVRAEPVSYLTEEGKIRFVGVFAELEDELCAMTTAGYVGSGSPNRADALVWGIIEIFPGIAKASRRESRGPVRRHDSGGGGSWMGV